jgi:glycosyltransferase involved in cell wall biosynthesis
MDAPRRAARPIRDETVALRRSDPVIPDPKKRLLRVVVMLANVKQYRTAFYPMLSTALARHGVDLTVIYSAPNRVEASKGDNIELEPPLGRKVPRLFFLDNRLLLQFPRPRDVVGADLVIIVQSTGYLLNYPLLLLSTLRLKRVAFWGHGRNHQGDPRSFSEYLKRVLVNSSDWWFAHTAETKRYLESLGVHGDKITAVDNATDTRALRRALADLTDEQVRAARASLGIPEGAPVGLFCGSLYKEKAVDYLVSASSRVAEQVPGFHLLVIGAGPDEALVKRAAETSPHIRYLGPLFNAARAVYFRMADVFLNPGLVGLSILDSFAAGLPLITTRRAKHSPEIAYLIDGENGMLADGDSGEFAQVVSRALGDPDLLRRLKRGAQFAADRYTIENMVENVKRGILQCLELPIANDIR